MNFDVNTVIGNLTELEQQAVAPNPLPDTQEPDTVESDDAAESDAPDTQEDAPETDEAAAETVEDEPAKPAKRGAIPLDRHEKILAKSRSETRQIQEERDRVLAELQQIQQAKQAQAVSDQVDDIENQIDELESVYQRQMADGELEEANKTGAALRRLERAHQKQTMLDMQRTLVAQELERDRYQEVIVRVQEAYPILDSTKPDTYDERTTNRVVKLMNYNMDVEKMSPTKALQDAVVTIMGDPVTTDEKRATLVSPRKKEAVDRNLKAAVLQPVDLTRAGSNNSADTSGLNISEKDLASMNWKDVLKAEKNLMKRL